MNIYQVQKALEQNTEEIDKLNAQMDEIAYKLKAAVEHSLNLRCLEMWIKKADEYHLDNVPVDVWNSIAYWSDLVKGYKPE